jgi:homoserine O-succinyltransferase
MPLNIPITLPAVDVLRQENIFVMDSERASTQEIRPLKLLILNLMPIKITTETDLIRLLSNSPLQLEIDFLHMESHTSKNTPIEHLMSFYKTFDEVKKSNYDGMIITGAPVEQLEFEEVTYWDEITGIFKRIKRIKQVIIVVIQYSKDENQSNQLIINGGITPEFCFCNSVIFRSLH